MAEGFLGRWVKRKEDARRGLPLDEPVASPVDPTRVPPKVGGAVVSPAPLPESKAAAQDAQPSPAAAAPAAPPLPSLQDAQQLNSASDFKPFMARGVLPEVKNAAMKKLFADPHYNVMDRLDIYIDDYGKSDPIPESMLRQMVSAKFLNLFEEEAKDADSPVPATATATATADPAACPMAVPPTASTPCEATDHDDPHLRLQSNDAATAPDPGRGTE